ncbi:MOSC domain-containing protein [Phenylobacterium sp. VNQ135]|uniref:MOSC domain-containing protein n=1 Tax=Phenylobacterium sp. VNQ135 TaxID=3400922 RepID=UPI003C0C02E5
MHSDGTGVVVAVSRKRTHGVDKPNQLMIRLIAGLGVEGDAHCGETVRHRSRRRFNPGLPNLRQAHLLHAELFDELATQGFAIRPGLMGENITTRGVDLLSLPKGALIHLGDTAIVELTGLRNPCVQLEALAPGLMQACLGLGSDGAPVRKAGVMGIVVAGGEVQAGDPVRVELPEPPHEALRPV